MKFIIKSAVFIAALFLLNQDIFAQKIQDVDFYVKSDRSIVVSYFLSDVKESDTYRIWLEVSSDGGFTFDIMPKKLKGDVGNNVKGKGRKKILWNVLRERDALISDEIVIKVVGKRRTTVGHAFGSLFVGNRWTRRRSNGFSFYGSYRSTKVNNESFNNFLLENGEGDNLGYSVGAKITKIPFIYRLEFFIDNFPLRESYVDSITSDDEYYSYQASSGIALWHEGASFSINYTPLPIFVYLLLSVGVGYETSRFRIGELVLKADGYTYSAISNDGAFASVEIQLNILRRLHFSIGGRTSLSSKTAEYTTTQIKLNYNFGGAK